MQSSATETDPGAGGPGLRLTQKCLGQPGMKRSVDRLHFMGWARGFKQLRKIVAAGSAASV
jgi:hypothetical protein